MDNVYIYIWRGAQKGNRIVGPRGEGFRPENNNNGIIRILWSRPRRSEIRRSNLNANASSPPHPQPSTTAAVSVVKKSHFACAVQVKLPSNRERPRATLSPIFPADFRFQPLVNFVRFAPLHPSDPAFSQRKMYFSF